MSKGQTGAVVTKPDVAHQEGVPRVTPEAADVARRVRGHLRQQMAERGLNQSELADRLAITRQAMSQILTGERGIGVGTILRVSRALHITPTRLMEEDPDPRFMESVEAPQS